MATRVVFRGLKVLIPMIRQPGCAKEKGADGGHDNGIRVSKQQYVMTGWRFLALGIGMATGMAFLRPRVAPGCTIMPMDTPASAPALPEVTLPEVRNTSWKALYPAIADTVTLRFGADSSAILSPTGVPILESTFKLTGDLVSFHDVGGMNACKDFSGSYHVRINGDTLALVIDEDPCDTRAGMLILKPWIRKR